MKKGICVLAGVIALTLAGCQMQFDPSNAETNSNQTIEDSTPDPGSTSEGDPVNTDADTNQADENDGTGKDTNFEGDSANTDADTNQTDSKDDPNTDTPSEDDPANTPIQSVPTSGDIRDTSSIENDSSGAAGAATLDEQAGERKLKSEGSLRGEIEVTHKLSLGKSEFSEGETLLFHIETKSADSELKITLTGSETGTTLEGSVAGIGDISFEINTADEYTVVIENCSLRGVQFTINYSIGGSK